MQTGCPLTESPATTASIKQVPPLAHLVTGMRSLLKLRSNPYLDGEPTVETISSEISAHESAISIIDKEISELSSAIRRLEFRKWEHGENIRYFRGLITLARRLPLEILANIFGICVREGYTRTPLVVSHVCSQWREAACIPSVWSHVYVDFDSPSAFSRTKFWLTKAKDCYLHITMEIRGEQVQLLDVINLLLYKRTQWRSLNINSALLSAANQALTACKGPFPELHTFSASVQQEFSDNDQIEEDETRELVNLRAAFHDAPRLSAVRIVRNILPDSNIIPYSIKDLSLVLPSHYSTATFSVPSVLRILEDLHNLEKISIIIPPGPIRRFELEIDTDHIVILPSLHSITLAGRSGIHSILPNLITPNLHALCLRSSDDLVGSPDAEIGQYLYKFLDLSSPPLEELELRDADIPAAYFIRCFSRMGRLKTLRLHESEISDSTLTELFGPYGLCPSLSIIDLRWCGHFRGRTLVDLVRSRQPLDTDDLRFGGDLVQTTCTAITKIIAIHCSFVTKQDIVDLAHLTVCQVVVMDSDDYCRGIGCCINDRYRRRLALEGIGRTGKLIL
ncbi:hypothetical protein Agabi119p4_4632 [Agaricus bisporus var. burnettii]|uniref:F-box domain-containing protein n=1 Tax=Agaricus bisporus var. burnettii TaxID=192524 RepID=A0A8H7F3N6_AGABI|nr:hypothetical protein Agabi119p4_4632 [Agaricus bisporus var. burnettii]